MPTPEQIQTALSIEVAIRDALEAHLAEHSTTTAGPNEYYHALQSTKGRIAVLAPMLPE